VVSALIREKIRHSIAACVAPAIRLIRSIVFRLRRHCMVLGLRACVTGTMTAGCGHTLPWPDAYVRTQRVVAEYGCYVECGLMLVQYSYW